jgi:hypothetical protein
MLPEGVQSEEKGWREIAAAARRASHGALIRALSRYPIFGPGRDENASPLGSLDPPHRSQCTPGLTRPFSDFTDGAGRRT